MNSKNLSIWLLAGVLLAMNGGPRPVLGQAATLPAGRDQENAQPRLPSARPSGAEGRRAAAETQPGRPAVTETAPATMPPTTRPQPRSRTPYTAPGAPIRAMSLLPLSAAHVVAGGLEPGGSEFAQSSVMAGAVVSRQGLGTSPSRVTNVVVSGPGLTEGPARGLGFSSRRNTILRPRANPLTGPNGALRDLNRAGFPVGGRFDRIARFRR